MANVYLQDSTLTSIAEAIRGKNGTTNTYKPSEMPAAITAIETGGGGSLTAPTTIMNFLGYSANGSSSSSFTARGYGGPAGTLFLWIVADMHGSSSTPTISCSIGKNNATSGFNITPSASNSITQGKIIGQYNSDGIITSGSYTYNGQLNIYGILSDSSWKASTNGAYGASAYVTITNDGFSSGCARKCTFLVLSKLNGTVTDVTSEHHIVTGEQTIAIPSSHSGVIMVVENSEDKRPTSGYLPIGMTNCGAPYQFNTNFLNQYGTMNLDLSAYRGHSITMAPNSTAKSSVPWAYTLIFID